MRGRESGGLRVTFAPAEEDSTRGVGPLTTRCEPDLPAGANGLAAEQGNVERLNRSVVESSLGIHDSAIQRLNAQLTTPQAAFLSSTYSFRTITTPVASSGVAIATPRMPEKKPRNSWAVIVAAGGR